MQVCVYTPSVGASASNYYCLHKLLSRHEVAVAQLPYANLSNTSQTPDIKRIAYNLTMPVSVNKTNAMYYMYVNIF